MEVIDLPRAAKGHVKVKAVGEFHSGYRLRGMLDSVAPLEVIRQDDPIAMEHAVNANQVFKWRRFCRLTILGMPAAKSDCYCLRAGLELRPYGPTRPLYI
jgi:hypothetical protein